MSMSERKYILSADLPHPDDRNLSIVLARLGDGQWVTWYHRKDDGGNHSGNYFAADKEELARADWARRVARALSGYAAGMDSRRPR